HHAALRPLTALHVGSQGMPAALVGTEPALGLASLESFALDGADTSADPDPWDLTTAKWRTALTALSNRASATVRTTNSLTLKVLEDVGHVAASPIGAGYPDSAAGLALRDAARLLKS